MMLPPSGDSYLAYPTRVVCMLWFLAWYSTACMHMLSSCFIMNILVWNCNGAASRSFLQTLRDLMFSFKPSVLGLVETKCSGVHANRACSRVRFDNWLRVEVLRYSGGIWLFWKDTFDLCLLKTHPQFIHARISDNNNSP